jgi:hypothetical protein
MARRGIPAALAAIALLLTACGSGLSADQAYFIRHELDARVAACLPFPGGNRAREAWVEQMSLREAKSAKLRERIRRLMDQVRKSGKTVWVTTTVLHERAMTGPELHRAVLCMRRHLARQ